ncbi:peptidase C13 family-domain-containing protein [Hyaloraphidium curvatum]|nr:peptidase C13 family-domain-containing protein [Hyaloraphidium curvatum]
MDAPAPSAAACRHPDYAPPRSHAANLQAIGGFFGSQGSSHTSNWAVLVDTSRFWFNYRHIANTLSVYRTVKRLGIPDERILLMLADDVACNPRNKFPATVFNSADALRRVDLYGDNVEVDYRGYEVTVENFIRLLTAGRHEEHVPRSKRLLTDERSNILVYMTGHGGEEFLKFQDNEEISSYDIADAFEQMWEKRRYNEIMFMADTCQASSLFSRIYTPNIVATGSSRVGQNSYSHHTDLDIGVAVIDRFTYYNLETLERLDLDSHDTLQQLFATYDPALIHSDPGFRNNLSRALDRVLITDFFGGVTNVELTHAGYPLSDPDPAELEADLADVLKDLPADLPRGGAVEEVATLPLLEPRPPEFTTLALVLAFFAVVMFLTYKEHQERKRAGGAKAQSNGHGGLRS